jgi:hypothetical protein
MAPIKFEEKLKDKLEKRTLSPSSDGWSKLSDRLDADEKKSKNPFFWWLSIAAGLIIMIAVTAQFFGTEESEKIIPNLVEEKVINEKTEQVNPEIEAIKSSDIAEENSQNEEIEKSLRTNEPQRIDQENLISQKSQGKKQLAETNTANKKNESSIVNDRVKETNELDFKNAVAAALNDLNTDNTSVTDKEVDSLLKLASKALFRENLNKERTQTVDATELLMSVEDDMGQSFRSRVFEALKESYSSVKTAVVERRL